GFNGNCAPHDDYSRVAWFATFGGPGFLLRSFAVPSTVDCSKWMELTPDEQRELLARCCSIIRQEIDSANLSDASVLRDLMDQDLRDFGIRLGRRARFCGRLRNLTGRRSRRLKSQPNPLNGIAPASSLSCFATWSARWRCRLSSTPRTCARSSAQTTAAPSRSTRRVGSLRSTWETRACLLRLPPSARGRRGTGSERGSSEPAASARCGTYGDQLAR